MKGIHPEIYLLHQYSNVQQKNEETNIIVKVKEFEDQIKALETEIIDLKTYIESKKIQLENIVTKQIENSKRLKVMLSQKDSEIIYLKNTIEIF